jgi:hypothetical protein
MRSDIITFTYYYYYYLFIIVKNLDARRTCNTYGETRNAYKIIAGKLQGENHLGDVILDERLELVWNFKD